MSKTFNDKISLWANSHKNGIAVAEDIVQTLCGAGLIVLAISVYQSLIDFYEFIMTLVPEALLTTQIPFSGQVLLVSFPLLIVLTIAIGLYVIFRTMWLGALVNKIGDGVIKVKTKLKAV